MTLVQRNGNINMGTKLGGFLNRLFEPFRRKAREQERVRTQEDLANDKLLREHAERVVQIQRNYFLEQEKLADELRREQRRNHFSDLVFSSIPIRNKPLE